MDALNTEIESETPLDADEPGSAAEDGSADEGMSRKTMTAEEALKRVKQGETVTGVKVVGLVLKGEFSRPVTLQGRHTCPTPDQQSNVRGKRGI